MTTVQAGNVSFSNDGPLALIAGPCVIESEEHVHKMAANHPLRCGRFRVQGLV